jgi:hypothetical protein
MASHESLWGGMPAATPITSWLGGKAACRRLGVTLFRLGQLVAEGELVAMTDFWGRRRYDPAGVELLRARMQAGLRVTAKTPAAGGAAGKAQALAFKLFGEGRPAREIVVETGLAPDTVVDLRRKYASMGGDLLITARQLEELRDLLDWRGPANDVELMRAIRVRLRSAFARGQAVAAEPAKHTTEGDTSGNIDGGAAGEGGRAHEEKQDPLSGDRGQQAAE